MKKILCSVFLFVSSAFAVSCATMSLSFDQIDERIKTWEHAPVDDLYLSWGPPKATQTLSNGDTVISYSYAYTQSSGGYSTGGYYIGKTYMPATEVPLEVNTLQCTVLFTVRKKTIVNWSYDGNLGAADKLVKARPGQQVNTNLNK
mgnify:CR=1 FL=1